MTYTPTEWKNGDTITAEKLNNMESGIVNSGIFYIEATWDDSANGFVLNKTVAQIEAAYANGQLCLIIGDISSRAIVAFGAYVVIDDTIDVDVANNQLILTQYELDAQTGVVTGTEYKYTLTPAE